MFDLDGTLYIGKTPLPGAIEKLKELRKGGIRVLFLTNAAMKSREDVALKLERMGFEAKKEDVYCGSFLLAKFISRHHEGKGVYVVGEKGIFEELALAGIRTSEEPDIVAVGLDRAFTYEKLAKAHAAIVRGAVFLASNSDHTYPTESGPMPGAGAIVQAIEFSCEKKAHVIGKPNPFALEIILAWR